MSSEHSRDSKERMKWIELNELSSHMTDPRQSTDQASDLAHCSLCRHPYKRSESTVVPFCSVRCQQLDLGLWLDEKIGLPVEGQEEQEFSGYESEDDS